MLSSSRFYFFSCEWKPFFHGWSRFRVGSIAIMTIIRGRLLANENFQDDGSMNQASS